MLRINNDTWYIFEEREYYRRMLWREKELLELLKGGKLNTSEVVKRANMSKATALKYLEGLKGRGLITCEKVGPTKLWSLVGEEGDAKFEHQDRILEYIQIDREIFRLLDEFESVTGKKLEVTIDQNGIHLQTREKRC